MLERIRRSPGGAPFSDDVVDSVPRLVWDVVVFGLSLVVAFIGPMEFVSSAGRALLSGRMEALVTIVFTLDLFVRNRRRASPRFDDPPHVRWAWIAVDLLAALPLAPLLQLPAAGFLHLVKIVRVGPSVRGLRRSVSIHPSIHRLVLFVFGLMLSAHWLACGWVWLDGPTSNEATAGTYLAAMYWCMTTLTTVGYGDVTPNTPGQTIYAMVVMLLGVGVYGFVIGNVLTMLTKMDMARAHYVATLERLSAFLRYRRIPTELQRHVYDYYKYLWEQRMGYDEASVLADLPPTLRRELALVLKGDLIEKLSWLEGASRELIHDLCAELEPVVFTPGEVIVRCGEYGRLIYFISSGQVEVIGRDGETVLGTLSAGDFFGELALLHEQPRTATVRATGYCDMYTLDRESFANTLTHYPDFAAHVAAVSEERLRADAEWVEP